MLLILLWMMAIDACSAQLPGFRQTISFLLNNHKYAEIFEQPWFRHPHTPHTKIPIEEVANSSFGQHFLPEGDIFVKPYWTKKERGRVECLDLGCACGLFDGIGVDKECVLPSKKMLKKAIRTELRMLKDEDRLEFEAALNRMKRDGTYNRISRFHKYAGIHSGPAFTVWHRELLKRFELVIRSYMPSPHTWGVPYWDSSLDAVLPEPLDSIVFSPIFLGEVDDEGHVVTGPYANWTTMEGYPWITRKFYNDPEGELLSPARIDWIAHQTDVNKVLAATLPLSTCTTHDLDDRFLEFSHDYVHFFISGDMGKSWSSSNDVVFILHHSMIDYMFEMFRQNSQNRTARATEYPESDEKCFPQRQFGDSPMPMMDPFLIKDGLSNGYTDHMYEFAPRPTCNRVTKDCGSKYLFCNTIDAHAPPFCVSKVRLGGNCTGLEGTAACYQGECISGQCHKVPPGHAILHSSVPPKVPSRVPSSAKPSVKPSKRPSSPAAVSWQSTAGHPTVPKEFLEKLEKYKQWSM